MTKRDQIKHELEEMRKIKMIVPRTAFQELDDLNDDCIESMSVSDAADLCVQLAGGHF